MNSVGEVIQAVSIGFIIASFLLDTCRVVKAIELCKEGLFILDSKAVVKEHNTITSLYKEMYWTLLLAYNIINNYTNAVIYGRKLLHIHHICGERTEECAIRISLAKLYLHHSKYAEAKELCENALLISTEIGHRNLEASCYEYLGMVYQSVGAYDKAREYHEKALITKNEIGDEKGKASSYGNLGNVFRFVGDYTKAIEYHEKALAITKDFGERNGEASCYGNLGNVFRSLGNYKKAREYFKKALAMAKQIGNRNVEVSCHGNLGTVSQLLGEYDKAKRYLEEELAIRKEIGDRKGEASSYRNLGTVFHSVGDYAKAKDYIEEALAISKEIGDREGEEGSYGNLGAVFHSLADNFTAEKHLEKALAISKDIGDRKGEATFYGNLGTVFQSVGEYGKSEKYLEKALAIRKEIGDRKGEASSYGNLGTVFNYLCDYPKAEKYIREALAIRKEIGDRKGEAADHENLGYVFRSLGDYVQAKEHFEKAFAISKEIGDRNGIASSYASFGTVFQSLGDYLKAKEHDEKALEIRKEIVDRAGEASSYGNIGTVLHFLGDYVTATEYLDKALRITQEIRDKNGEASCYGNLGTVFHSVGEYVKAKEHFEKALAIQKEIGDKKGETSSYLNLGGTFLFVGEDVKAQEYYEKALAIQNEIGDIKGQASSYESLGTVFHSLGRYAKANEHFQKALAIKKEIGDRGGEGSVYGNLGTVFQSIGDYEKAREYHEKALTITKDICNRYNEAANYLNMGIDFQLLDEIFKAEKYYKKALVLSEQIGDIKKQFLSLYKLALLKHLEGKIKGALSYLLSSIQKYEDLRSFLRDNDQFKISFSDKYVDPYRILSALFCFALSPNDALYVSQLGRARALADLMSSQYSMENQISANPQSWIGIQRVMRKERNCTCLYLSYSYNNIFFWIFKGSGDVYFENLKVDATMQNLKEGIDALDALFAKESFRSFGILPEERCEDRSHNGLNDFQRKSKRREEDNRKSLHLGANKEPKLNLALCYKLIIAPVVDIIESPEILIVPERSLYNVPFAALPDESGKYLSETFRILVVPSLTTLRLIQDSPADYHSQTGAIIVGNPDVGRVRYKGRLKHILPLPCAEREAIMVGEKLGVKPLIGQEATKQAVLQVINSASLIHFAAHGDAERGEIALAPLRPFNKIPQEEDYLLTMSDISKVQLRAKLVVLSCCHSGRGQIRAEGVVGIARAFLGSGARSVLVALWALDDNATEQFMNRFYEHLVIGESASECLHEAMKWMRCNGYSDVRQWAPFMLIGDNVTFDFGNYFEVSYRKKLRFFLKIGILVKGCYKVKKNWREKRTNQNARIK